MAETHVSVVPDSMVVEINDRTSPTIELSDPVKVVVEGAVRPVINVSYGGGRGPIWLPGNTYDSTSLAAILAGYIGKEQLSNDLSASLDALELGLNLARAALNDAIAANAANGQLIDTTVSRLAIAEENITSQVSRLNAAEANISTSMSTIDNHEIRLSTAEVSVTDSSNYIATQETILKNEWTVKVYENADGTSCVAGTGLLMYPSWKIDTVYDAESSFVWFDGNAYKAIVSHTASEENVPPNGSYWELLPYATKSQFGVFADKFFVQTTIDGEKVTPFMIQEDQVMINGDLLVNGLVKAGVLNANRVFTWSIQSENYVSGISGYSIDSTTGHVEFNDIDMTLNYSSLSGIPTSLADIDPNAAQKLNYSSDYNVAVSIWNNDDSVNFCSVLGAWTYGPTVIDNSMLLEDSTLLLDTTPLVEKRFYTLFLSDIVNYAGNKNNIIKLRIKQLSGSPTFTLRLYYKTSSHDFSSLYYNEIQNISVTPNEYTTLIFDMSKLTFGASDWITSNITQLCLDIDDIINSNYEIEWIALCYSGVADQTQFAIDNTLDTTTGGIIVRDISEQKYAHFTGGDLTFYDYVGNQWLLSKSVTKIISGVCEDGETINIGYFRNQPKIILSPYSLISYNSLYSGQSQKFNLCATNLHQVNNNWYFDASVKSELASNTGMISAQELANFTLTWGVGGTYIGQTITLPNNVYSASAVINIKRVCVLLSDVWYGGYLSATAYIQYLVESTWIDSAPYNLANAYCLTPVYNNGIVISFNSASPISAIRVKVIFTQNGSVRGGSLGYVTDLTENIQITNISYSLASSVISIEGQATYLAIG